MKVKVNEVEYTLAIDGIRAYDGADGSKTASFKLTDVESLDDVKDLFDADVTIEVIDNEEQVADSYEGYSVLASILYEETGDVTVTKRTLTHSERLDDLEESQEIQDEAIDDLANDISDITEGGE